MFVSFVIALIISFLNIISINSINTNYCKKIRTCVAGAHTVCTRNYYCGPARHCIKLTSDYEFREKMVQMHNDLRNKVANGSETLGSNTGAADMLAISYDLELEYVAQCWTHTCPTGHDKCRHVPRFFVGQNWFSTTGGNDLDAVDAWYSEVSVIDNAALIDSFQPGGAGGQAIGHYTQVVWSRTQFIGCARASFRNNRRKIIVVCNYGPAGNMLGDAVYKRGKDGNECGSHNKEFPALCGETIPTPRELSWSTGSRHITSIYLLLLYYIICYLLFHIL